MTSSAKARQGVTQQVGLMVQQKVNALAVAQLVYGVISAVSTTAPTVSVTLQGTSNVVTGIRYEQSYEPDVGDTVYCARVGTDLFVMGSVATVSQAWIVVGSGGSAPAFQNSWGNFGSGVQAPRFQVVGNKVYIEGGLAGGSASTTAFTLPAAYRPLGSHNFFQRTGGTDVGCTVQVNTNGTVVCGGSASSAYVSLDGIVFDLN